MEPMLVIATVVVGLGLAGLLLQGLALRSALGSSRGAPVPEDAWPPVSILKPLSGLDDNLFGNLESFCRLDYPHYEIICCLRSANDPALAVAVKVRERNPRVPFRILVSGDGDGLNPKVRNLLPGYRAARHDAVLISDSNVEVRPEYLRETARRLLEPDVGLVTNPIRGRGARTFGAALENLHLNTFVAGGTAALFRFLRLPCVVGKSMLFRRSVLESIGGLAAFRNVLAEDFVIGRQLHRAGMRVVLAPHAITNVNIYCGTRRFLSRHSRWGKLRRRLGGVRYGAEILANPVFTAACAAAVRPGPGSLALLAAACAAAAGTAAWTGRQLESQTSLPLCLLAPVKDLIAGAVWFVPFISMRVVWRGHRLRVGADTRVVAPAVTGRRRRSRILTRLRPQPV
jgi:ceramide glucosyltransferase